MSDSLLAATLRAVFVSYAREDTASAQRIAEALRSHGVEVWFDQDELRGGDAWDQKIRKQINDCTLFLPIISKHTQERGKGYFRLEWKLAVEQTHLMAEGIAFLAPVVVDDTAESGAVVPPEFMRVQWMRLPGALPTPQFVEQIKHLLNASVPAGVTVPPMPMRTAPVVPFAAAATKSRFPTAIVAALGAAVLAFAVYVALRPATKEEPAPVATEKSSAEAKPVAPIAPAAPKVDPKSIAVLPFANRSPDKENEFFTDGVHEDILTNLGNIRELRVVSNTSVAQYRGTTKSMKQIGVELNVAYILEGSVQRVGNKVHVTGQLIDARTDAHLWAKSFDKDLSDVFAIQAELAHAIADELQTVLSPQEKNLLDRRPTTVAAAYDLFLRARDRSIRRSISTGVGSGEVEQEQEALLQAAVKLDPSFVEAWLALGQAHLFLFSAATDHSTVRLTKAKAAIDQAASLAPDSPAVMSGLGNYFLSGEHNFARAAEQFEKRARLQPNSAWSYYDLAQLQRLQGRWAEALANLRKATTLDPALRAPAGVLVLTCRQCRRFDEALAELRRMVARWPEQTADAVTLAQAEDLVDGSTRATDTLIASLAAKESNLPRILSLRKTLAATRGDFAEFVRLDRQQPYFDADGAAHYFQAMAAAVVYFVNGDAAAARARLENFPAELRQRLEREPTNPRLWQDVGLMEAILGHNDEAVRSARKAVDLIRESPDADRGPLRLAGLAVVHTLTGDKDSALAELKQLLQIPSQISGLDLKSNQAFFPLRGDPRFEALVNDPKNNAPLF